MAFTMPLKNTAGLSAHNLSVLKKVLAKLHEDDSQLHDQLLVYLVDGGDDAVLKELPKIPDGPAKLGLGCASQYGGHWGSPISQFTFLRDVEVTDVQFCLRLAKAFEATSRHLPADRFFCQPQLDNNRGLEILLQEAVRSTSGVLASPVQRLCKLSAEIVLKMITAEGHSPEKIIKAPFSGSPKNWQDESVRNMLLSLANFGPIFARHRELVVPFLTTGPADSRVMAVENLARTGADPAAFTAELVAAATDSSKTLREAAQPLLKKIPVEARPELERLAQSGNRTEREHAVRLLGRIHGEEAREFLSALKETENSAPVREAIDASLGEARYAAAPAEAMLAPSPHEEIDLHPPVTPALREAIEKLFADYNRHADQHNEKLTNKQPNQLIHPNHPLKHVEAQQIDQVCRGLEKGGQIRGMLTHSLKDSQYNRGEPKGPVKLFLEHPDCRLIHAVRFLAMAAMIGAHQGWYSGIEWPAAAALEVHRSSHSPAFTLLDLAEAVRSLGLSDGIILDHALESYFGAFEWEWETIWPYYYGKLNELEQIVSAATSTDWSTRYRDERRRDAALKLLAKFPQVPSPLVGKLWELAIGAGKVDRQKTQPICAKLPDVQERLALALASGNAQTRQVAAEWLGRLGEERAVAPLTAAAKQEKQDAAIDAMLTALERLGQSVEPFLDRDKLQTDAVKNLKKGTPPALGWFPWSSLPKVHWQDSDQPVPEESIVWLIVQSNKLKNPEAGSLLRRYCDKLRPADREQLGSFVLGAWLNQDLLRKYSDAECRQRAQQQAPQQWQMYQKSLAWYQQNNHPVPASFPKSQQECEESLFQQLQREVGSAVGEKGILALASACCGDAAVAPVQKYLKEWYGHRAAQCKALIAMLAGVDRPLAIQYLLSIANRFRTKGIREEAEKYVHLLAERKGWTLDELADRTMPSCGLDDDGTLELSYGPRSFAAKVNTELEIALYDSDGKPLKKLPDPRKDDDEEQAKAAKKAFSAAKSELKKFVDLTTTRLHEAMCTQRTWPAADWRMYLLEHPLARFLCQRLVWAMIEGDAATLTFRPLDDGTLTGAGDETVTLPKEGQIRIAHTCNVPRDVAQAWAQHLADYEVSPLFVQFGRQEYELPEDKRPQTEVKDFEGHMVEAFQLRGLATKFGYTRGQAEDGGWFYEYQKSFPGLGLEVHLGFSGNGLPEENRKVALTSLSFAHKSAADAAAYMARRGVALADIPAVLLTECIGDVRAIAAAGSGFDPEWEKKSAF